MPSPPMTQDQNAAPAANESTLCAPCAGIQRPWRRAPGHAELVQANNRQEARGAHTVTVTRYRCDHCGAIWDYENNRADQRTGWSLVRC